VFVHELFRHGARASDSIPYTSPESVKEHLEEDAEPEKQQTYFPNGLGMLTASGIRQHYLLGTKVRKDYVERHGLINGTYDVNEFYIQSTQVPRTIQSAQSQLMGIFPLGSATQLKENQVEDAIPQIEIEDKEEIQKSLGLDAIIDRFQPIPVHNYEQQEEDDVLGYADCPLMIKDYMGRIENPDFWKPFDKIYQDLYPLYAKIFGIPEDMITFMVAFTLTDALYAERFEGVPDRYDWSDSEWQRLREMQPVMLLNSLSKESGKAIASRYLNPIVEMMKKKTNSQFNETATARFGDSKMVLFSSHDLQLSHIINVLNATNYDIKHVDYASNLFIELHHSESKKCSEADSNAEECYSVSLTFNGVQLHLPGCKNSECSFGEFTQYMSEVLYDYETLQNVCHMTEEVKSSKEFLKMDA